MYSANWTYQEMRQKKTEAVPLFHGLIVSRAAGLARQGRLLKAEEMLSSLMKSGQASVEAINLLAKINAQQGRMDEAEGLWKRALAIDPSNAEALRAVERCNQLRRKKLYGYRLSIVTPLVFAFFLSSAVLALDLWYLPPEKKGQLWVTLGSFISRFNTAATHVSGPGPLVSLHTPAATSSQGPLRSGLVSQLKTSVERAIEANPAIASLPLQVIEENGTIRITGEVPNLETRYLVETTVGTVPGVRHVDLRALKLTRVYEVQPGDSLWLIAKKMYGTPNLWNLIAQSNQISPDESLMIGRKLLIPRIQDSTVQ